MRKPLDRQRLPLLGGSSRSPWPLRAWQTSASRAASSSVTGIGYACLSVVAAGVAPQARLSMPLHHYADRRFAVHAFQQAVPPLVSKYRIPAFRILISRVQVSSRRGVSRQHAPKRGVAAGGGQGALPGFASR